MTTSGTTLFNLDIDDLIVQAYDRLGGEDINAIDLKTARTALNLLFLDWQNRGIQLWKVELKSLPLIQGQVTYQLPQGVSGVLDGVLEDTTNPSYPIKIGMKRGSLEDYNHISALQTTQRPSQYFVHRLLDFVEVRFWPIPPNDSYVFWYWSVNQIEDVSSYGQTADVNTRFLPALIYGLAYHLSIYRNQIPMDFRQLLKAEYMEAFNLALEDFRERVGVRIKPSLNLAYKGGSNGGW